MPIFSDASMAAEYADRSGNGVHMIRRRAGANPIDITRFYVIDIGENITRGRASILKIVSDYFSAERLVSYQFYETTEKLRRDYPEHFTLADPHANGCPDAPGICECFAKR